MKIAVVGTLAVAAGLVACIFAFHPHPVFKGQDSWNPKAAAAYLDQREDWWANWPRASKDHGTFCVSCHTVMPYALSQSALRTVLPAQSDSPNERKLIESVTKRVRLWQEVRPYYPDYADKSRGTEAVLNALVLASHDAQGGKLTADTRTAFDNMWALQQTTGDQKGGFSWIQFDNEPWEAYDSQYYGASLAAVAIGLAPENYRSTPEIQNKISLLHDYLGREYAAQTPINHVVLLWASAKLPGLLTPDQQGLIINEVWGKQQKDGGWCLASLVGDWKRSDESPLVMESDGYATGLITFALLQAGVSRDNPHVEQGLSWLTRNQGMWGGHWSGYSLNKRRHNPFSYVARFMDDAATAYAVLALTQAKISVGGTSVEASLRPRIPVPADGRIQSQAEERRGLQRR
jgi:squalene-hopene/tetraprenyl-beta-curcumene cyclase